MNLGERLVLGDKRAAARLISLIENKDPQGIELLKKYYQQTGWAYVVGITGPPGAGKSTLTDKLVKHLRASQLRVGVIAIDPTSPFTGGAILGDRVRMNDLAVDKGVFIRSMGARGHLGGLSSATSAAVKVLDLYGCDYIFIETVGVGQSEVDIVKTCDTTLMVTVPGLGDDIQAIKAGIFEIGDVFAVNKSDREGAIKTARELEVMLDYNQKKWKPPVKLVTAAVSQGIEDLWEAVEAHKGYLLESGEFEKRRIENTRIELLELIKQSVMLKLLTPSEQKKMVDLISVKVAHREIDPYSACEKILSELI